MLRNHWLAIFGSHPYIAISTTDQQIWKHRQKPAKERAYFAEFCNRSPKDQVNRKSINYIFFRAKKWFNFENPLQKTLDISIIIIRRYTMPWCSHFNMTWHNMILLSLCFLGLLQSSTWRILILYYKCITAFFFG